MGHLGIEPTAGAIQASRYRDRKHVSQSRQLRVHEKRIIKEGETPHIFHGSGPGDKRVRWWDPHEWQWRWQSYK